MNELKAPVLATLAYYDVLGLPLTANEVWKYLINPSRFFRSPGGLGRIEEHDIGEILEKLVKEGKLIRENEFYFLPRRRSLVKDRQRKNKIADRKWRKFKKLAGMLVATPYLRGLFASGSLALNNTEEESDFDVLTIAAWGRLYTCRFFLWLISSLMFARRKPYQEVAPDKLCFNHYITDARLTIPHESLFNAQTYINLRPVVVYEDIFEKFYGSNMWLNTYAYNFKPDRGNDKIKPNRLLRFIAKTLEKILDTRFGDWVEAKLKKYQQDKISSNPVTYEAGGRVIFTNYELEFHPRSFELSALAKYKNSLNNMGLRPVVEEKDSGLNI